MERPYIIYHMLTSIDYKVSQFFSEREETDVLFEQYYQQHRSFCADAFLLGATVAKRVLGAKSVPDLTAYQGIHVERCDYIDRKLKHPIAVVSDPRGTLGWEDSVSHATISCYDKVSLLELVTEQTSDAYLAYLREKGISYLICGEKSIEVDSLLTKLLKECGVCSLILEGDPTTSRKITERGMLDEVSLLVAPFIMGGEGKSIFGGKTIAFFTDREYQRVQSVHTRGRGMWMRYRQKPAVGAQGYMPPVITAPMGVQYVD